MGEMSAEAKLKPYLAKHGGYRQVPVVCLWSTSVTCTACGRHVQVAPLGVRLEVRGAPEYSSFGSSCRGINRKITYSVCKI